MDRAEIRFVESTKINLSQVNFQYFPSEITPQFYFGGQCIASIHSSPHFRFLNQIKKNQPTDTDYYQWLIWRRKSKRSARQRANKYVDLYNSIRKYGLQKQKHKPIIILPQPFITSRYGVETPFTPGFEIWSGHHRLTVAIYLGLERVKCLLYEDKKPGSGTSKYDSRLKLV